MLRRMNDLEGLAVETADGAIGHVKDLYLDDSAWVARYLVVETGSWLSSRRVLISPIRSRSRRSRSKTALESIPRRRSRDSAKPSISATTATTATHSIGAAVASGARALTRT